METKKGKAVIWLRVSTKKQELESQRKDLVELALRDGYKKSQLITVEGLGASAVKQDEVYQELVGKLYEVLEKEPVTCVYVWEISRLARRKSTFEDLREYLINNKIQLFILKPRKVLLLDDEGKEDKMADLVISFSMWIAAEEMKIKAERFSRGRARARAEGKFNGGAFGALFGYKVVKKKVIEDLKEAELVNLIFEEYSTGKYSAQSLAQEMRVRGYTVRGNEITDAKISHILSNRAYIGESGFKGIVKLELWNKVEAVRKNKTLVTKTKESKYQTLGAKLIKCSCGSNYFNNSGKYVCYRHFKPSRFPEGERCKDTVSISVDVMDDLIWRVTKKEEQVWNSTKKFQALPSMRKEAEILEMKWKQTETRLTDLKTKLDRLNERYILGKIKQGTFERMEANLEAEGVQIQRERREYKRLSGNLRAEIRLLEDLQRDGKDFIDSLDYDNLTQKEKRVLVEKHVKEVTLEKGVIEGRKVILVHFKTSRGKVNFAYFWTLKDKSKQIVRVK